MLNLAPTRRAGAVALSLTYVSEKVPVNLSGPAKTMLSTLYLKALDADFDRPVLGDRFAKEAIGKLDFDWRELQITPKWAPLFTVRTAQYDIWVRDFLAAHKDCTVVHLGCGLDCRVFRINPGANVRWYDVDFPQVIALREQIYPTRPDYQLIATPATEPDWLDQIPADRPTLLIAEGISMYLTEDEGIALQSNDTIKEILFWDIATGKKLTNISKIRNLNWYTWTCTVGWPVQVSCLLIFFLLFFFLFVRVT